MEACPREAISADRLLVQHLFESAVERGGDLHGLAQLALPLGGLLGQDVAFHRLVTRHLARPRDLETLRGTLVRLLLRQGCLLSLGGSSRAPPDDFMSAGLKPRRLQPSARPRRTTS